MGRSKGTRNRSTIVRELLTRALIKKKAAEIDVPAFRALLDSTLMGDDNSFKKMEFNVGELVYSDR